MYPSNNYIKHPDNILVFKLNQNTFSGQSTVSITDFSMFSIPVCPQNVSCLGICVRDIIPISFT